MPAQFSFVTGSEKVTLGTPRADGEAVVFPVIATASQVRHLDPDTLRQQVKGKSVDEARAILADDGTVDIQTWPGFVGTIPSLEWRLTLTIVGGGEALARPVRRPRRRACRSSRWVQPAPSAPRPPAIGAGTALGSGNP